MNKDSVRFGSDENLSSTASDSKVFWKGSLTSKFAFLLGGLIAFVSAPLWLPIALVKGIYQAFQLRRAGNKNQSSKPQKDSTTKDSTTKESDAPRRRRRKRPQQRKQSLPSIEKNAPTIQPLKPTSPSLETPVESPSAAPRPIPVPKPKRPDNAKSEDQAPTSGRPLVAILLGILPDPRKIELTGPNNEPVTLDIELAVPTFDPNGKSMPCQIRALHQGKLVSELGFDYARPGSTLLTLESWETHLSETLLNSDQNRNTLMDSVFQIALSEAKARNFKKIFVTVHDQKSEEFYTSIGFKTFYKSKSPDLERRMAFEIK